MHAAQRTMSRRGRKETAAYFAKVTELLIEKKKKTNKTRDDQRDFKDKRGNKKISKLTRKSNNVKSSTASKDQNCLSLSYTPLKSL